MHLHETLFVRRYRNLIVLRNVGGDVKYWTSGIFKMSYLKLMVCHEVDTVVTIYNHGLWLLLIIR